MSIDHVKETAPGIVAGCATVGSFAIAWLTQDGIPVLHALSLLAGVAAGFATALYYLVMAVKARGR